MEYQKQIAWEREETANTNALNELIINKSVKPSPFRMRN